MNKGLLEHWEDSALLIRRGYTHRTRWDSHMAAASSLSSSFPPPPSPCTRCSLTLPLSVLQSLIHLQLWREKKSFRLEQTFKIEFHSWVHTKPGPCAQIFTCAWLCCSSAKRKTNKKKAQKTPKQPKVNLAASWGFLVWIFRNSWTYFLPPYSKIGQGAINNYLAEC